MFVLKKSESYSWPVSVKVPVSGGQFKKETFDAEFKRLSQSRIQEVIKNVEEMNNSDFCKEILLGWKGIQDDGGEEIPFSESARDTLLDVPAVAGSIVSAFFESLSGEKRKN